MAKIEHVIGVLFLTQCLFLLTYGQQGIFDQARRDALTWLSRPENTGRPPRGIRGMIVHHGAGNGGKDLKWPNKLPPAPAGYQYYEFYAPFNLAFQLKKPNKGTNRVILALNKKNGMVHKVWYYTPNHYKTYIRSWM